MYQADILNDQHVIVTGGGTGLGRAMALRFAELGAKVTICGRREEPLEKTVADIREAGGAAEGISCNIRDQEAVEAFVADAEERQGPVTRLVNNAAGNFLAEADTLSPNAFDAVVKTNLYGTFYATQACGRRWIERETPGVVLSVSTTYAETGSAFVLPSAVSKAGIMALTKSLASEWGVYGIRLNAVAPGPFPTKGAWSRLVPKEIEEQMRKRVPLGRVGDPRELADFAVFMLTDLSAYMTGEHVIFDGGEMNFMAGQFNDFARLDREQVKMMFAMMRG
ncbi:MAG: SDR family oxidoreductase [Bacteroidota bacterium]